MIDTITLTSRLANQLQRAELASRAGQLALARKFELLARDTERQLIAAGAPKANATAGYWGGITPPRA